MANESIEQLNSGQYVKPGEDKTGGFVQPVSHHEEDLAQSVQGSQAEPSKDAALHAQTNDAVKLPGEELPLSTVMTNDLPERVPNLRNSGREFGLYHRIKRAMEQRMMKRKQGKEKEEPNAA